MQFIRGLDRLHHWPNLWGRHGKLRVDRRASQLQPTDITNVVLGAEDADSDYHNRRPRPPQLFCPKLLVRSERRLWGGSSRGRFGASRPSDYSCLPNAVDGVFLRFQHVKRFVLVSNFI